MKTHFTFLCISLLFLGQAWSQDCGINFGLPAELILCSPQTITLDADISGNYDQISWSPLTGLASPTGEQTQATITTDITYTVTTRQVTATELILNGDFSMGDTGFTSDYIYGTGGGVGLLSNEGQYAIATNAGSTHNQFANCRDHTGGGEMMVVNASGDASNVWCQTVTISPNTDYLFSAWVTSVTSQNPAQLQFSANGQGLGSSFNASPSRCNWQNFTTEWQSGNATTVDICIANTNFTPAGNDFALDDISLREICVTQTQVDVSIAELNTDFVVPTELCNNVTAFNLDDLLAAAANTGGTWTIDGTPLSNLVPANLSIGSHEVTYRVLLGDCELSNTQSFNILAAPNAGTATDFSTCFAGVQTFTLGDQLNNADIGGSWRQVSGETVTDLDAQSGTLSITAPGQYQFSYEIADTPTCPGDLELVSLNFIAPPVINLPSALTIDCTMPTLTLGEGATTGAGDLEYQWFIDGTPQADITPTILVDNGGEYTLIVTNADDCSTTASTIVDDLVDEINLKGAAIVAPCQTPSQGVVFLEQISGGTAPYLASLNDGPLSQVDSFTNLSPGQYELLVQDAGGCEASATVILESPVVPVLILSSDPEAPVNLGEPVQLSVFTDADLASADSVIWFPSIADSLRVSLTSWRVQPTVTTNYSLTLIDENGCIVTADVVVPVIPEGKVFIPNAFSPNDDGTNDNFVIYDAGSVAQILQLDVFDRWGNQVYQSNTLEPNSDAGAWDGTARGQVLAPGVYIYSMQVEWINGEVSQLSGEISLIY